MVRLPSIGPDSKSFWTKISVARHQQYISGLEKGRRNPTIVTVYELATALGVSHLDLLQMPRQSGPVEGKAKKPSAKVTI
ncbi:helix-turn-helix domain-containing protein [Parvibaculum sedimenti]|uniref:Helix-turn-helix domain-containing protein n=1 Tax=Parvibaculum sedimenti TaxID=2608632 RepID=A0A6N6VM80_9HYPH|nr:helix-turn-helix domain-containing protein [Parvibaculum sedimenti]